MILSFMSLNPRTSEHPGYCCCGLTGCPGKVEPEEGIDDRYYWYPGFEPEEELDDQSIDWSKCDVCGYDLSDVSERECPGCGTV